MLDAQGEQDLLELPLLAQLVRAEHHVARHLLGDGGRAHRAASVADVLQVGERGARDGERIDALVGVEVLVLGGDEGALDLFGDGADRGEDAALVGELGHQPVVTGIDATHHRRLIGAQAVQRRQVGGVAAVDVPADQCRGACADQDDGGDQPEQAADEGQHGALLAGLPDWLRRLRRHDQAVAWSVH